MSLENTLDYGVRIDLQAPIKYEGKIVGYVDGFAYSWPNSGTLKTVAVDHIEAVHGEMEVPDPFLYAPDNPMDRGIAEALWTEARAKAQTMQDAFDEAAARSRYGAETEAALRRVG